MSGLKVTFVVQGEGRGHMTQALALAALLRDAGHEILRVMVGRSPWRPVPEYFSEGIGAPLVEFDAPTQVPDANRQGLSVTRTVADAVKRSPRFFQSTVAIAEGVEGADVVVNLLDLLGGISRGLFPVDVPALAVAHNYLFLHPDLADAPGPAATRQAVLAYAKATTAGTERKLALSFMPMPAVFDISLEVTPPLLRPGIAALQPEDGDFLLAYALNPGYGARLLEWQRTSGAEVHCFVEGGAASIDGTSPGFHAHELDGTAFLERLAGCRAYVGSAGFESLCEAHYLGKPVLAVPTEGQFEQTLNAWDAERCDVAMAGSYDDLDRFWADPPTPSHGRVEDFRAWVHRAPEIFVDAIERTARRDDAPA